MLYHRMQQFRRYNDLTTELIAKVLEIPEEKYLSYESGKEIPDIDTIERLADLYKVTINEFFGYTPRLMLYDSEYESAAAQADVDETTLHLSDLSWDEKELLLYYRAHPNKEALILESLRRKNESEREQADASPNACTCKQD